MSECVYVCAHNVNSARKTGAQSVSHWAVMNCETLKERSALPSPALVLVNIHSAILIYYIHGGQGYTEEKGRVYIWAPNWSQKLINKTSPFFFIRKGFKRGRACERGGRKIERQREANRHKVIQRGVFPWSAVLHQPNSPLLMTVSDGKRHNWEICGSLQYLRQESFSHLSLRYPFSLLNPFFCCFQYFFLLSLLFFHARVPEVFCGVSQ